MEAVGNDPTQAYLCAGVLQTLELSIAQRLHKSFSKNIASHYVRTLPQFFSTFADADIPQREPCGHDSLLFVIHVINVNSWSGWGISKSQPLASKASRLPLTIHPDIWYPEMVTLHRQTIISRPFFY